MQISEMWKDLIPAMISVCRRNGAREPDFEEYIKHSPYHSSEYAAYVIRGQWPEVEDVIKTAAAAAMNYVRNVIRGRWEQGEEIISTDADCSYHYARTIIKGRFEKGELAIASNCNYAFKYAIDVLKGRFVAGEATICAAESKNGDSSLTKNYYETMVKKPEDWASWELDQLKLSPCWMYMYAKEYIKGRLPDVLHNTMNVFAMTIPDNYYVKRYFKAKKYNKKIKRRNKTSTTIEQE